MKRTNIEVITYFRDFKKNWYELFNKNIRLSKKLQNVFVFILYTSIIIIQIVVILFFVWFGLGFLISIFIDYIN